jgi:hypothetical protein
MLDAVCAQSDRYGFWCRAGAVLLPQAVLAWPTGNLAPPGGGYRWGGWLALRWGGGFAAGVLGRKGAAGLWTGHCRHFGGAWFGTAWAGPAAPPRCSNGAPA